MGDGSWSTWSEAASVRPRVTGLREHLGVNITVLETQVYLIKGVWAQQPYSPIQEERWILCHIYIGNKARGHE